MRTLLSDRFAPITSRVGFLEVPLDAAAAGFESWQRSLNPALRVTRPDSGFPGVLLELQPLTSGTRARRLLVEAGPKWTAYFDCSLRGTDAVSTIGHLSRLLMCQGLAINSTPHMVGQPGVVNGRAGAVQFELFGPLKTDFINYVRTVSDIFDGRKWRFDANGVEQAFEETDAYTARSVRDRFTSEMLERYCQALGVDVFNPAFYGPRAVLFATDVVPPAGSQVMSLDETQQWLEIRPDATDALPG